LFVYLFLINSVQKYDTIRYDTRCYFNVRSKADIGLCKLNLPHGTKKLKSGKKRKTINLKNGYAQNFESIGKRSREYVESLLKVHDKTAKNTQALKN